MIEIAHLNKHKMSVKKQFSIYFFKVFKKGVLDADRML